MAVQVEETLNTQIEIQELVMRPHRAGRYRKLYPDDRMSGEDELAQRLSGRAISP